MIFFLLLCFLTIYNYVVQADNFILYKIMTLFIYIEVLKQKHLYITINKFYISN